MPKPLTEMTKQEYEQAVESGMFWVYYPEAYGNYYEDVIKQKDSETESINNVKIRVNNPDHSKAIQEWLFERGCKWYGGESHVQLTNKVYLYCGRGEISFGRTSQHFQKHPHKELDLQHLDPHSKEEKPFKDPCKITRNKSTYDQYSAGNTLYKQLQQLSELESAIERHDNKQNKRRSERQKLLEKIGRGLPKGVKVGTDRTLKPF